MTSAVYIDADILIWHLRGLPQAADLLLKLASTPAVRLAIAAVQRMEVVFHLRPAELEAASFLLSFFVTEPLTGEVVDLGAEYYRRWHGSHGIHEADALLAATATLTGGRIVTQNTRHFPMPEVAVERGWP